jgi:hypothetical protein
MTDAIPDEIISETEKLRKAAHEAPLAKVYEDHKGRKFIGVHTDAWWKTSREWMKAIQQEASNAK